MTIDSFITTDVATCGSNDRVADVAALMSERRIRHLPIVDAGILKGMISASDIVTFLAKSRSA
ncbi:MAG: CBS domain-containing protein [Rhodospirillales bacterium]|nr:CBS domain-containing protein [Rhodospirillales bacterium]